MKFFYKFFKVTIYNLHVIIYNLYVVYYNAVKAGYKYVGEGCYIHIPFKDKKQFL